MTLEDKIIDYITKHYRGSERPVSSKKMADAFNSIGFDVDDGDVQQAIGEIRRNKKGLIGSDSQGFFLIISEKDLAITQAYIKRRIAPIVAAAEALNDMWQQEHGPINGDLFECDMWGDKIEDMKQEVVR